MMLHQQGYQLLQGFSTQHLVRPANTPAECPGQRSLAHLTKEEPKAEELNVPTSQV